jgi:hypothetical protein
LTRALASTIERSRNLCSGAYNRLSCRTELPSHLLD